MYRVTTPTHVFTFPDDTSEYAEIQITYTQGDIQLVKHYQDGTLPPGMTLENNKALVTLSQAETKAFNKGIAKVQVRVMKGFDVFASKMFDVEVNEVNNEEILE